MLLIKAPVLSPKTLAPGKAVKWGMSQTECLAALGTSIEVVEQSTFFLIISTQLDGYSSQLQSVDLLFDDEDGHAAINGEPGLWRIEVTQAQSQNFLDEPNYEAVDALTDKFQYIYDGLVAAYTNNLGLPDFIGRLEDEDYPDDQAAWQLAFWNRLDDESSRFQIEFDHPDRESPLSVKIVCYNPLSQTTN